MPPTEMPPGIEVFWSTDRAAKRLRMFWSTDRAAKRLRIVRLKAGESQSDGTLLLKGLDRHGFVVATARVSAEIYDSLWTKAREETARAPKRKKKKGKQRISNAHAPVAHTSGRRKTYAAYLKTAHWDKRKKAYYSTHRRECRACGSPIGVDLHHLSYEKLGGEPDTDLMPLCRLHHDAAHQQHQKGGRDLRDATWVVVQRSATVRSAG